MTTETKIDNMTKKLSEYDLRYACQRCFDVDTSAETTVLIGGLTIKLCGQCVNAWHEHIATLPEWKAIREIDADMQILALAHQIAEARAAMHRSFALRDELYEISKRWLEATKTKVEISDP